MYSCLDITLIPSLSVDRLLCIVYMLAMTGNINNQLMRTIQEEAEYMHDNIYSEMTRVWIEYSTEHINEFNILRWVSILTDNPQIQADFSSLHSNAKSLHWNMGNRHFSLHSGTIPKRECDQLKKKQRKWGKHYHGKLEIPAEKQGAECPFCLDWLLGSPVLWLSIDMNNILCYAHKWVVRFIVPCHSVCFSVCRRTIAEWMGNFRFKVQSLSKRHNFEHRNHLPTILIEMSVSTF